MFWYLASNHNVLKTLFICDQVINEMFNVGVHAALSIDDNFVSVHPDISKLSFGFVSHNNCSHEYLLPNSTHSWRTNWKMLGKKHQDINIISHRRIRKIGYKC